MIGDMTGVLKMHVINYQAEDEKQNNEKEDEKDENSDMEKIVIEI